MAITVQFYYKNDQVKVKVSFMAIQDDGKGRWLLEVKLPYYCQVLRLFQGSNRVFQPILCTTFKYFKLLLLKSTLRLQIIIIQLLFRAVRWFELFCSKVATASNNILTYYFQLFEHFKLFKSAKIALFSTFLANVAKALGETLGLIFFAKSRPRSQKLGFSITSFGRTVRPWKTCVSV